MATFNFWQWLVQAGIIQGDPNYYTSGQAGEAEYQHAIRTAVNAATNHPDPAIRYQLWKQLTDSGAIQGDHNYYAGGQASQSEIDHAINVASSAFKSDPAKGQIQYSFTATTVDRADGTASAAAAPGAATDVSPAAAPVGAAAGIPGVLGGGRVIQVERAGADDLYVMVYEWPAGSGKFISWQFDSREQVDQALGSGWASDPKYGYERRADSWYNTNVNNVGSATEITGMSGTFSIYMDDLVREAALDAGITDPTMHGRMVSDKQMQDILVRGSLEGWSEERIMAEKRKTDFWTKTLYPGIEKLYGMTDNPEEAWAAYHRSVESSLISLGHERDPDGSYRGAVGRMLDAGVEPQTFVQMTPVYLRAEQNPDYFNLLNQWTQQTLGKTLEFGDWFDALAGQAEPDVMLAAERATLEWLAQRGGTKLTAEQVQRLSNQTDLSEGQAQAMFAEFDEALTSLAGQALGKYGLSRDDIFALKTGVTPLSGRSLEDVRVKAIQASREMGLMDDEKAGFYMGFTAQGTPERPGLQATRPMGA
jgi:hypothetical protein